MKYTESEKRALYESIMRDVAKSVKHHLNENIFNSKHQWYSYVIGSIKKYFGWYTKTEKFLLYNLCEMMSRDNNKDNEKYHKTVRCLLYMCMCGMNPDDPDNIRKVNECSKILGIEPQTADEYEEWNTPYKG